VKTEILLCPVCEADLRSAGYEIQALDKAHRMDRCGLCGQRVPVIRIRLEMKQEEPRNDPGIE
jgi:hypothetical protein